MDNPLSAIPAITPRRGSRATPPPKAAWRIGEWCAELSISKAQGYNILSRGEVDTLKVGRMRFILTPPAVWLAMKAAEQKS
jgi:hypothetical protein